MTTTKLYRAPNGEAQAQAQEAGGRRPKRSRLVPASTSCPRWLVRKLHDRQIAYQEYSGSGPSTYWSTASADACRLASGNRPSHLHRPTRHHRRSSRARPVRRIAVTTRFGAMASVLRDSSTTSVIDRRSSSAIPLGGVWQCSSSTNSRPLQRTDSGVQWWARR